MPNWQDYEAAGMYGLPRAAADRESWDCPQPSLYRVPFFPEKPRPTVWPSLSHQNPNKAHLDQADCKGVRLDLANELLADGPDELVGGTEDEDVCVCNLQEAREGQQPQE